MNRITGESDAPQAREVLQVTFDGTPEVCAITALTCIGFQFLRGFVAAHDDKANGHERSLEAIAAATEIAAKVVAHLSPQVVHAVHAKIHDAPDPRTN